MSIQTIEPDTMRNIYICISVKKRKSMGYFMIDCSNEFMSEIEILLINQIFSTEGVVLSRASWR